MRYSPAHADSSGRVPFLLRGPKSLRVALSTAVASAIAFAPAVLISTPAQAAVLAGFSFSDSIVIGDEGDSFTFELERDTSLAALPASTLTWTITAGVGTSATAGEDYTDDAGSLPFPTDNSDPYGGDSLSLTVSSLQDSIDEATETFTITVTDGTDELTAEGRITDDDAAPTYTLSVNDPTPTEANANVVVTAELSDESSKDITIPLSLTAGTAKSGQDYTNSTPTITIPAGDTTGTANVAIKEDLLYEEAEQSFTVKSGTGTNVTGTTSTTVTIVDDEEQPTINVAAASATEGDTLGFDVTLSGPSERAVTVGWASADGSGADVSAADAAEHGTATAGSDYTAGTGTLTFTAATSDLPPLTATQRTISVKTAFDSTDETSPEDMHVTLSSPTIAVLGDDVEATGGITDDDDPPVITVTPSSAITEGNAGTKTQTYTVKLSKAAGKKVTVDYDVSTGGAGTATEVEDFSPVDGELSFAPGETAKTFSVDIVGDTTYEGASETFEIDLASSTADATNADETITITEDDAKPTFSVASVSMQEGDTGTVVVYPVKLSNAADEAVVFTVADTAGTAKKTLVGNPGDYDYLAPGTGLVIPAGQTTGYVYFLVNGDEIFEANEQMKITVTPDIAAPVLSLDPKDANLTLVNDDDAPVLTVLSVTGSEGDKVPVKGIVRGMAQEDTQFNMSFAGGSVNGSVAASTGDFTNPGTVPVTVDGGTLSGAPVPLATVELTDDTTGEAAETIIVSGQAFGSGSVTSGTLTIAESDGGLPVDPITVTLSAAASYRLGAGTLQLSGKTKANTSVQPLAQPMNSDAGLVPYGSPVMSDGNGNFSFLGVFDKGTGITFAAKVGTVTSSSVEVYLKQDPDFYARSSSRGQATLTVFGDPRIQGLKVRFLRANSNGTWSTVGLGELGSTGKASTTLTGLKSGASYLYKATVYGDGDVGLLTNSSNSVRVTVR